MNIILPVYDSGVTALSIFIDKAYIKGLITN